MKAVLISDIHDHTAHLLLALEQARCLGCEHLLCMGDITTLGSFRTLCEEWRQGMDVVFGNNEYDREAFFRLADTFPHVSLHGDEGRIVLDGRAIYMTHLPQRAARQVGMGFDLICFGHTHEKLLLTTDTSLLVNPGEVQGRRSHPSLAVYDTAAHSVKHYPL